MSRPIRCRSCGAGRFEVTAWRQIVAIAADVVCCLPKLEPQ